MNNDKWCLSKDLLDTVAKDCNIQKLVNIVPFANIDRLRRAIGTFGYTVFDE